MEKLIKKSVLFLLFVMVFSLAAGCGSEPNGATNTNTDNNVIETKEAGVLTIGMCATWPPFEYRDKNGELIGFDIDMANEICKDLELTPEFMDADWQGLVPSLQKGDYDILISCFAASELRKETVAFSDVYYELPSIIVVKDDNEDIKTIEDLKDKLVGVQMGTADEMAAEELNKQIGFKELKKYKLPPDEFLDLKQGGVEAVVIGLPYAVQTIKEQGGFATVGEAFDPQNAVMLTRTDNPELLKAVNESLARMKEDGTYDSLIEKWFTIQD